MRCAQARACTQPRTCKGLYIDAAQESGCDEVITPVILLKEGGLEELATLQQQHGLQFENIPGFKAHLRNMGRDLQYLFTMCTAKHIEPAVQTNRQLLGVLDIQLAILEGRFRVQT